MWLGRGDFDPREWHDALAQARQIHNAHEASYLIGTPLLADYLEEGIAALGSAREEEKKRSVCRVDLSKGQLDAPDR